MSVRSRILTFLCCVSVASGSITALKSNDLSNIKIFTYQMKPIVSPGDNIDDNDGNSKVSNTFVAKIDPVPIKVSRKPMNKTAKVVDTQPDKKLDTKKIFTPKLLSQPVPSSQSPSYRVASASPMNIIPDYNRTRQFARAYKKLVVGKGLTESKVAYHTSYRGEIQKNGPVMLRPKADKVAMDEQVTTSARLPISSAKKVDYDNIAMR